MTSFLSRLVERSGSGGAPSPMPVVPPLFAAGPIADAPAIHGEENRAATTDPSNIAASAPAASGRTVSGPGAPDSPGLHAGESLAPGERARGRDVLGSVVRPQGAGPARTVEAVSGRSIPAGRRRDAPSVAIDVRPGQRFGAAPADHSVHVRPADRLDRGSVDPAGDEPVSARAEPVLPARRAERVAVHASEAAPIIRVSIGRIEVRAVNACAPPMARPPAAAPPRRPGIVLEDYLRARGRER